MKHLAPAWSSHNWFADYPTSISGCSELPHYSCQQTLSGQYQKFLLPSLQCSNHLWDSQKKKKNNTTPPPNQLTTPVQFQIVSLKQSQTPQGLEDLSVLSVFKFFISCDKELWEQPWSATTACRCAAYVMHLQCSFWVVTEENKLLFPLLIHAFIYKDTLVATSG